MSNLNKKKSSQSPTATSRFKSFIRGSSAQPNMPITNYTNLKYVKNTMKSSTSNTSLSNSKPQKINSLEISDIEMNTKRRFASLKSISYDSFSVNSVQSTTNGSNLTNHETYQIGQALH